MSRASSLGLVVLVAWGCLSLFPMVWMLVGAVLPDEVLAGKASFSAAGFTLEHVRRLLASGKVAGWALNSLLVAAGASLGQVLLASSLGYVLAKHRFRGQGAVLAGLGLVMMVPAQVLVIPLFVLVARLGLVDTLLGVAVPSLVTPFGVLLMVTRMRDLPDELLDAARVDGCSEAGLFWRIALPLVAPTAATLCIFAFVSHWNAFLWPLLVLFRDDQYTLQVGLATLQGQHEFEHGLLLAGAALSALPMVAVFLAFRNAFARGVGAGGVKG